MAEHKVVAAAEAAARALGAEEILSVIAPAASELAGPPEARRIDDEEVLVAELVEAGMVLCMHPGLRKPGVGGTVLVGEERTIPLYDISPTP